MAAITVNTKTIKDGANANVVVKTAVDSGDTTTSPIHGMLDGKGFLYDPTIKVVTGTTITRPADTTAYAAGDIVASSTTAATVNAAPTTAAVAKAVDQEFTLLKCRLRKTGTSLTSAIFRVHCHSAAITVTNGDNGAWLTTESSYIGSFDVTCEVAFSNAAMGVGVPMRGSSINGLPASGTQNIHFTIEARAAYTPVSGEVFTVSFEVQ